MSNVGDSSVSSLESIQRMRLDILDGLSIGDSRIASMLPLRKIDARNIKILWLKNEEP